MSERRQHRRVGFLGMISYTGGDDVTCEGIVDISQGGLRLRLSAPEPPGAKIVLELTFPGTKDHVSVSAQVVWGRRLEPYEVGVRFLDLSDKHLLQLEHLIDEV